MHLRSDKWQAKLAWEADSNYHQNLSSRFLTGWMPPSRQHHSTRCQLTTNEHGYTSSSTELCLFSVSVSKSTWSQLPISPLQKTDNPSTSFISPDVEPGSEVSEPRAAILDLSVNNFYWRLTAVSKHASNLAQVSYNYCTSTDDSHSRVAVRSKHANNLAQVSYYFLLLYLCLTRTSSVEVAPVHFCNISMERNII